MPRARSVVIAAAASSVLVSVAVPLAGPGSAAAPAAHHATQPAPVRDVATYVDGDTITVDWKNPSRHFDRVVVRYRKGATAPTITKGSSVRLSAPHARSATLRHLAADTTYSVSVWTKTAGQTSDKRTATFTTDEADAGNGTYDETVTDALGAPLANVRITLENPFGGDTFRATSDSAGRVVRVLPSGEWLALIDGSEATGGDSDATGYVGDYDVFLVRAGRTATRPAIALSAGAAVTGRVTDRRGKPLAGVVAYAARPNPYALQDSGNGSGVSIAFYGGDLTMPAAVTAADGSYTVRGLPVGAQQLCFDPTRQEVTGGSAGPGGYLSSCLSDTVDLAAGVHTSMPDSQLRAGSGGAFVGRVKLPSGKPASGVFVEAFRRSGTGGDVETDASGRYYLGGLVPGKYELCFVPSLLTAASRTGYRQNCLAEPVDLAAATTTTENSTLRHGGAITGTVTGPAGHPLENVGVYTRSGEDFTQTDSRGHYTIGGLASRSYRICFDTSGTVPRKGTTGARPGCLADKIAAKARRVRTGGDIALKRGGAVTGTITDTDGSPVPNALVDLEPVRFDKLLFDGDATTDAAGKYEIGGAPAGRYQLCVFLTDDGGNTRTSCVKQVRIAAGEFTDVDKTLPPRGTIAVTVDDAGTNPVAGVDVVALRSCSAGGGAACDHLASFGDNPVRVAATGMTSADGTVSYSLLKPGNYAICSLAFYGSTTVDTPVTGYADRCTASFDVTVTAGAVTPVSQTLQLAGAITGKVTDSAGKPIRGAVVHVTGSAADDFSPMFPFALPGDPIHYSKTAADGTYTIRSVAPGDQTVCVDASKASGGSSAGGYLDQCIGGGPGSTTSDTPVSVKSGKTTTAPDLALTSGSGVSGTITSTGKLGFTEISVFDSTGSIVANDSVYRHGGYRFTGLPAGTYRVCAMDNHDARCYADAPWTTQEPPADATPVITTAGAVSSGIDVKLHG